MQSAFESWLKNGSAVLGEVRIVSVASDAYLLHHVLDDPQSSSLHHFTTPQSARIIAADDSQGTYRPLKSAPTLRRGWTIEVSSTQAALHALAYLYPGAIGLAESWERASIKPTPLRETLDRQTGMYRIAAKIDDTEADRVVGLTCDPTKCLKIILWEISDSHGKPSRLPPEKTEVVTFDEHWQCPRIPLLCREACTFVISGARKAVKQQAATANASNSE